MIRELPPGRLPIKTIGEAGVAARRDLRSSSREQLDAGRQAYVIYPLVEESEKIDLKAATEMADHLAQEVFPAYRVGLLHGRMKADAKDRVMKAFAAGELQILVSTTVVEVGVDVPNASVMIVEHAERFGLSQLHQLRGRVGRERASVVLLPAVSVAAVRRGARAAEGDDRHDRRLRDRRARSASCAARATSSARGRRALPTFRLIDLVRDRELLEMAQREAAALARIGGADAGGDGRPAEGVGGTLQVDRGGVIEA